MVATKCNNLHAVESTWKSRLVIDLHLHRSTQRPPGRWAVEHLKLIYYDVKVGAES